MTLLCSLLGSMSVSPLLLPFPFPSSFLASWPCHQVLNVALQSSLYWQSVYYNSITQHRLIRRGSLIQWHTKTSVLIIHSPLTQWMSLKPCVKNNGRVQASHISVLTSSWCKWGAATRLKQESSPPSANHHTCKLQCFHVPLFCTSVPMDDTYFTET